MSQFPPDPPSPLEYRSPEGPRRSRGEVWGGICCGVVMSAAIYISTARYIGLGAVALTLVLKIVLGGALIGSSTAPSFGRGILWSILAVLILVVLAVLTVIGICFMK